MRLTWQLPSVFPMATTVCVWRAVRFDAAETKFEIDTLGKRVMAELEAQPVVDLTRELVSLPSTDPPGDESAIGQFVVDWLESSDVPFAVETSEVRPGRENVRAKAGDPRRGRILLTGHMDVVPADESAWSVDPFDLTRRNGRIIGRGVSDMKGALAAKLLAAESYLRDHDDPGQVELAFVVGEERGGFGTEALVKSGVQADGVILGEPTDMQICTAQKGTARYHVSIGGESSHSGRPDKGTNAIDGARIVMDGLESLNQRVAERTRPLLTPGSVTVTEIEGGIAPNVVPDRVQLTLDCRLLPGTGVDIETLDEWIQAVTTDVPQIYDVAVDRFSFSPPMEVSREEDVVSAVKNGVEAVGRPVSFDGFNATTDARHFAHKLDIPVVLFGPGSIERDAHTVDESIRVVDLVDTAGVYRHAIETFCHDQ